MNTLLRSEFVKLRTTRTFVALTALAAGLSLLVTVLTGVLSDPQPEDVVVDIFANDFSSVFILILAVIGITGEWRHRTITGALLAAPDRLRFLAAKAVAFAGAGLVLSLLISAAVTVVGLSFVGVRDLPGPNPGELAEYITRSAGLAALVGAFGVALGARPQPGRGDRGRAGGDLRPGADAARDRTGGG
jgi:ABC-2 type transport system permease protein